MVGGGDCVIYSQIGKVYFLNSDFSANWQCSRLIESFFSQFGKNLVPETRRVLFREKA